MPPQLSTSLPFSSHNLVPPPRVAPGSCHKQTRVLKMEISLTRKRLIHALVFILVCASIFRLLRFAISTFSLPNSHPILPLFKPCDPSNSTCKKTSSLLSTSSSSVTRKDYRFLLNRVSEQVSCNSSNSTCKKTSFLFSTGSNRHITEKLPCNPSNSTCEKTLTSSHEIRSRVSTTSSSLTKKEYQFLLNRVSERVPCNLLIFGLEPEYLRIAKVNRGGKNIIIDDRQERIRTMRSKSSEIYWVSYDAPAKEAYELLKYARKDPACALGSGPVEKSTCKLTLKKLPKEVYRRKWDLILVDGPTGEGPEAPGRMASIYTASLIARSRARKVTNVVVHDVDRMIERWFSWEFLCEDNLVSSKGRFWNFKIMGGFKPNSSWFCSQK